LGLSLSLNIISLRIFLLQKSFSLLGLETSGFTFLVVRMQIVLSLFSICLDLSLKVIKILVFSMDSVNKTLILLNILSSAILNSFKELLIFSFNSLLLELVLLNELLHLTSLGL
jgi:hypothetical protein